MSRASSSSCAILGLLAASLLTACPVGRSVLAPLGSLDAGAESGGPPDVVGDRAEGSVDASAESGPPPDAGCATGMTMCGGACVNTLTSTMHCGACNSPCTAAQACANGVCVGTGELRFTLTWDSPGDVDLMVVAPCGTTIDYNTRMACGGALDWDDQSGTGPENIFWRAVPMSGSYLVCANPFMLSGPTNVRVEVFEGMNLRQTFTRSYTMTSREMCSRTSSNFLGEFQRP